MTDASSPPAYLPSGFLLLRRQGTLVAQHLDLARGVLTGDAITLADLGNVGSVTTGYAGGFSASADGRIAYRSGSDVRQVNWLDRSGKAAGPALAADASVSNYPEFSADGKRILLNRTVDNNVDVWIADFTRGGLTRFTFDPAADCCPVPSPDGSRIAFVSLRRGAGAADLYMKPASGVGEEQVLLATPNPKVPLDWSHNGRFLLYKEGDPRTGSDLWVLPMASPDKTPVPIARSPFDESNGQFSPDDQFVAYETNESGQFDIVVQTFPQPTGKWQVSLRGGTQPRWRADGKELYFIGADGMLMAAPVTIAGSTLSAGTPVPLFAAHLASGAGANRQNYAVARDGRFLIVQPIESAPAPITLILNWRPK